MTMWLCVTRQGGTVIHRLDGKLRFALRFSVQGNLRATAAHAPPVPGDTLIIVIDTVPQSLWSCALTFEITHHAAHLNGLSEFSLVSVSLTLFSNYSDL